MTSKINRLPSDLNALEGFVSCETSNCSGDSNKPSQGAGNGQIEGIPVVTDIVPNDINCVRFEKTYPNGYKELLTPIKAARINGKKILFSGNEDYSNFDLLTKDDIKGFVKFDLVASHITNDEVHVTTADKERWDNRIPSGMTEHISNDDIHVTRANKATWDGKQDKLKDGISIKTINGTPILGKGDINIEVGDKVDFDSVSDIFVTSDGSLSFTKRDKNGNVGTSTPIRSIKINGRNIMFPSNASSVEDLELVSKKEFDDLKTLVNSLVRKVNELGK